ncbi:hypothetical protein PHYSODRAFT_435032, partial [Phytophthora sojae]
RIVRAAEANLFVSAQKLVVVVSQDLDRAVSPHMIRNGLSIAGLIGNSAGKEPYLSKHRRQLLKKYA